MNDENNEVIGVEERKRLADAAAGAVYLIITRTMNKAVDSGLITQKQAYDLFNLLEEQIIVAKKELDGEYED
ncbi:MAG: hypothetical protein QXV17_12995 [Candidatus Micrarchaeaceae archaeon]